jgi:hypothetical protein
MLNTAPILILLALSVAPAAAESPNIYVQARVERTYANGYSITAPFAHVNMSVNASGTWFSFSGRPFSGSMSQSGSFISINGSGVSAHANSWGGNYRVDATVQRTSPPLGSLRLSFTMQANGPVGDPRNPPSYTVWEDGNHLNVRPVFGVIGKQNSYFAIFTPLRTLFSHESQGSFPEPREYQKAVENRGGSGRIYL